MFRTFQNFMKILQKLNEILQKFAKISKLKSAIKVIKLYQKGYELKNAMNWFTTNIFFALL